MPAFPGLNYWSRSASSRQWALLAFRSSGRATPANHESTVKSKSLESPHQKDISTLRHHVPQDLCVAGRPPHRRRSRAATSVDLFDDSVKVRYVTSRDLCCGRGTVFSKSRVKIVTQRRPQPILHTVLQNEKPPTPAYSC